MSRVVLIVLAVVLVLLGLYWLPTWSVGDWTMRKVDLLADIRSDSAVNELLLRDSIASKTLLENDSNARLAHSD